MNANTAVLAFSVILLNGKVFIRVVTHTKAVGGFCLDRLRDVT